MSVLIGLIKALSGGLHNRLNFKNEPLHLSIVLIDNEYVVK